MTVAFRPVDPAVIRRAAAEAERTAFKAALDAALRTLMAAALSAALSLAAWQAWRWATQSPVFALREVRFTGLVHASEAELARRSGLALGENMFHADLARAARAIEAHPWVLSASLRRELPGTIAVSVVEHRPAALVQFGADKTYVLDFQGKLFKRASPDDGLDLPIVTGLSQGSPDLAVRLLSTLHVLDIWGVAGFLPNALAEVRVDDSGFTLLAHDSGSLQEIRLGLSDLPLKLRRLTQLRAALSRRGERASRIDLDNPARPAEAAATLADKR